METRILPFSRESIAEAARLIAAGEPVAVPTETVYGLAADADQPALLTNKTLALKARGVEIMTGAPVPEGAEG